jgi:hypothetical protein
MGARSFIARRTEARALRREGDPADRDVASWSLLRTAFSAPPRRPDEPLLAAIGDVRATLDIYYRRVKDSYEKCYVDCEVSNLLDNPAFVHARQIAGDDPGLAKSGLSSVLAGYEWSNRPAGRTARYRPGSEPERSILNLELAWAALSSDTDEARKFLKAAESCLAGVSDTLARHVSDAEWAAPPDVIGDAESRGPVGPGNKYYKLGLDVKESAHTGAFGLGMGLLMGQVAVAQMYADAVRDKVRESLTTSP